MPDKECRTVNISYGASLVGLRFNSLKVIGTSDRKASNGDRYWTCMCDCGRVKDIAGYRLRSGITKSCGKHPAPTRFIDLAGRRYGRIVAVSIHGRDKQGRLSWLCDCDCGSKKIIPSRHIVNGAVTSCGCKRRESSAENGRRGAVKISGKNSHLYKDDLSESDRISDRNIPEVREWRRAVFERDSHTCQLCGVRGRRLHAHHLHSWAEYKDMRFDVSNGVALCREHHEMFHAFMGGNRIPCTSADYEKFKARWYIDREIHRRKGERDQVPTAKENAPLGRPPSSPVDIRSYE